MEHFLTLDFSVLGLRARLELCLNVLRGHKVQIEDPSPDSFDEEYEKYMGDLH